MNSSELKGYLTGLILGDGSIGVGISKRCFEIKSINKDFIDKIHEDISSCTNFKITVHEYPENIRNGVRHKQYWQLTIGSHPYFAKKYHHFYDDKRKRIASCDALSWLTPAGLANWYMSDGYICLVGKTKGIVRSRRVDISTDRYDIRTIKRMIRMLFDKFGIGASLIKRGEFYRIRICRNCYEDFFNLIRQYITPSMRYKMYLGYENQPEWMSDEFWNFQEELRSAVALNSRG